MIDSILDLEHLSIELLKSLQSIAPFGMGNPKPVF